MKHGKTNWREGLLPAKKPDVKLDIVQENNQMTVSLENRNLTELDTRLRQLFDKMVTNLFLVRPSALTRSSKHVYFFVAP